MNLEILLLCSARSAPRSPFNSSLLSHKASLPRMSVLRRVSISERSLRSVRRSRLATRSILVCVSVLFPFRKQSSRWANAKAGSAQIRLPRSLTTRQPFPKAPPRCTAAHLGRFGTPSHVSAPLAERGETTPRDAAGKWEAAGRYAKPRRWAQSRVSKCLHSARSSSTVFLFPHINAKGPSWVGGTHVTSCQHTFFSNHVIVWGYVSDASRVGWE